MKIKIFNEKKGAEKYLSFYWFVILFLVAASVVYMAVAFYGKPYDVREVEANLLISAVADCFVDEGYFNYNELKDCGFNFEVGDFNTEGSEQTSKEYFLEVQKCDFDLNGISNCAMYGENLGNSQIKINCGISKDSSFPYCAERSFYTLDENQNKFLIKVFAGVRKTKKNA